jgi:hypothetical protein
MSNPEVDVVGRHVVGEHRSTLVATLTAILWLLGVGMYFLFISVYALVGLVPAVLLLWQRNSPVAYVASALAGVGCAILGIAAMLGWTAASQVDLAGFVIVPVAIILYSVYGFRRTTTFGLI